MFTDKFVTEGRIIGIGVDIMRRGGIYAPYLRDGDPFLKATYSENERKVASSRRDPYAYYEKRFCAKEAVFKTLGCNGQHILFNEIEILNNSDGWPYVTLYGKVRDAAAVKGIAEIKISISDDEDYCVSIAVAQ